MERWRYLADDDLDAARGLAGDEVLVNACQAAGAGGVLRLYTYRSHCALVGRFQNVAAEVDEEECERLGIPINRRPTGGGAIIMGEGQLGVAVVSPARTGARADAVAVCQEYSRGLVDGLRELGIEACFRPRNDVEVNGRKIAGTGVWAGEGGAVLFHASLLCDLDVPLMLRALRIPAQKIADKAIAAVQERTTTVIRELGRRTTARDVREVIRRAFARALDVELVEEPFTVDETRRIEDLVAARYGTRAWVHQRTPAFAAVPAVEASAAEGQASGLPRDAMGMSLVKTGGGLLRVYVAVAGEVIKSVLVTGDFFATTEAVAHLEARLKWSALERERILAAVREEYALRGGIAALEPAELTEAVWRAGQSALEGVGA